MSILIAVPCYAGMSAPTATGLFMLGKAFQAEAVEHDLLTFSNSSLISKVRSHIANIFLHTTRFDYLLFIDSDIGFAVSDVWKLLELQVPFAAAPYPMKSATPRYNFKLAMRGEQVHAHPSRLALQVERIGSGMMLIHRTVFEQLAERHPELRYTPDVDGSNLQVTDAEMQGSIHFFETLIDPETRSQLSEDFAFCRRACEAGIEIWMRIDTALTHSGHAVYRDTDLAPRLAALIGSSSTSA